MALSHIWQFPMDGSSPAISFHGRDILPHSAIRAGQIGHIPSAYLDPRGHERAHAGVRLATLSLLRQSRRVSGGAAVLYLPLAARMEYRFAGLGLPDDAGGSAVCPDSDRLKTFAGLFHHLPIRVYSHRFESGHSRRDRRRVVLLPQPRPFQGHALSLRRSGST